MSSMKDRRDIERLEDQQKQLQQSMTLITAAVDELKVHFPQFNELLGQLSTRLDAIEANRAGAARKR